MGFLTLESWSVHLGSELTVCWLRVVWRALQGRRRVQRPCACLGGSEPVVLGVLWEDSAASASQMEKTEGCDRAVAGRCVETIPGRSCPMAGDEVGQVGRERSLEGCERARRGMMKCDPVGVQCVAF